MTKTNQKIPEGWSVKKLENCILSFSGGTPSANNSDYYEKGTIPFIRSGEISQDFTELFITEKGLKESSAKIVEKGDLLLALYGANSGETSICKIHGAINQAILCIRMKNDNLRYLENIFIFYKNRILQKYLQGGQGNLSAEIVKSLCFKFPPLAEQEKIAEILGTWDTAIEKLSALIEQKKQLKKGLMQRLLTGKQRLPGFSAPWSVKKLGEMGKFVSGGTPDTEKPEYWNGDIIWLTPSEITKLPTRFVSDSERKITKEGLKNSSAVLLPVGSLIVCTRATVGDCCINIKKVSTNQGFKNLIPENNNIDFLYYLVSSHKTDLIRKACGSTFLEISKHDIEKLKYSIPTLPEQEKIADILSKADEEIALLTRKLSALKTQKTGLMQKLLTGQIRVKVA